MFRTVAVICCVLSLAGARLDVGLTEQEKQAMLEKHNALKRAPYPKNPGVIGKNMKGYIWDDELALTAKRLVDTCVFKHGAFSQGTSFHGQNKGQNLGVRSADSSTYHVDVIQNWFDEYLDYDLDAKTCSGVCGHYTQIVWDKSERVGCAKKLCANLDLDNGETWKNAVIIACDYYPAGNFIGQAPFEIAANENEACAVCSNGCKDKLCIPDVTDGQSESCFEQCAGGGYCIRECSLDDCTDEVKRVGCACVDGSSSNCQGPPTITNIFPRGGSIKGGTEFKITGSGFSDEYSDDTRNEVSLVRQGHHQYVLTLTVNQAGSGSKALTAAYNGIEIIPTGTYNLKVKSFGGKEEAVCQDSDNCEVKISANDYTPKVKDVIPSSINAGGMVRMNGKIFTDRFGSQNETGSNGLTAQIKKASLKGGVCEISNPDLEANPDNNPFNIELTRGYQGNIDCQVPKTIYIGYHNLSFFVTESYGKSYTEPTAFHVSGIQNNQHTPYTLQVYPEINSISPEEGGDSGGTLITIKGSGLHHDDKYAPVSVKIGGGDCTDVTFPVEDTLVCKAPEKQSEADRYSGGRGIHFSHWNSHTGIDDLDGIQNKTDPDSVHWASEFGFYDTGKNLYSRFYEGYFIPPRTAEYQFQASCDDHCTVYFSQTDSPANKEVEIEQVRHSDGVKLSAKKHSLVAGNRYYIAAAQSEAYGHASLSVGVKMFESKLVSDRVSAVQTEKQKISVVSTVIPEQQTIALSGWQTQNGVKEVQEIQITGAGFFQLGLNGYLTETMDATSVTSSQLQAALRTLPPLAPNGVTVTGALQDSGTDFTVEFQDTELGDFPDLMSPAVDGLVVTVTETTKGKPTMNKVFLEMGGVIADGMAQDQLSADLVSQTIEDLFSVRGCPASSASWTMVEDFEGDHAYAVKSEAYCGKGAGQFYNSWSVITDQGSDYSSMTRLDTYRYLCLAYKGQFDRIRLYTRVTHFDGAVRNYLFSFDGLEDNYNPDENKNPAYNPDNWKWDVKCLNIYDKINKNSVPRLRMIWLYDMKVQDWNVLFPQKRYFYIDNLLLAKSDVTEEIKGYKRITPPNGVFMESVNVTSSAADTYEVKLYPQKCVSDFKLFNVFSGNVASGGIDQNNLRLEQGSWPAGVSVTITRQEGASGAPEGSIIASISGGNNVTRQIQSVLHEEEMAVFLNELDGIGEVKVVRTGTCHNYDWNVEWITPGNQPLIEVTANLAGGMDVSVTSAQDAATIYSPIPGDMLETIEKEPQVVVTINDIKAHCKSNNCSYTWNSALAASVTSVSPSQGSKLDNTVLTIGGTGFSDTDNNNVVTIGGEPCEVTEATTTQIKCNIGAGPAGEYLVDVNVQGVGSAAHDGGGPYNFTYEVKVGGINPVNGSIGGCTELTVTGVGFKQSAEVEVDGNACTVKSRSYDRIVCTVPAGSQAKEADVNVTQDGASIESPTKFKYDSNLTPVIESVSQENNKTCVEGGMELLIVGTGFGAKPSVKVGGKAAQVVSSESNDTHVRVVAPALDTGDNKIQVMVADKGCADLSQNNIAAVSCTFKVSAVAPSQGSWYGGTILALRGEGFSDSTKVKVGDTPCKVQSANETDICCQLEDTGKTFIVNVVSLPTSPPSFKWQPQLVKISEGDKVNWRWAKNEYINNIRFSVQQTPQPGSHEYDGSGFSSGEMLESGSYTFKFTSIGTFYYSSGQSDRYPKWPIAGTVEVQGRQSTREKVVVMSEAGIKAENDTSSGVSVDAAGCIEGCECSTDKLVDGCSGNPPAAADNSVFSIALWECSSAEITAIEPFNGTTNDAITITGQGFSDKACENMVRIGEHNCNVTSSTNTKIVCHVQTDGSLSAGDWHPISLQVCNRGFAINRMSPEHKRNYKLVPRIDDITPTKGSLAGLTLLTITGDGFSGTKETTQVAVGSVNFCDIVSMSYTEITCNTQKTSLDGTHNISVYINSNKVQAVCPANNCEFTYSTVDTPALTDVTPTYLTSAQNNITLTGTGFGSDANAVTITIGSSVCNVISHNSSGVETVCEVGCVEGGWHELKMVIAGVGRADPSGNSEKYVTTKAQINSITPNNGSIHGGTLVTVSGLCFASSQNMKAAFSASGWQELTGIQSGDQDSVVFKTPAMGSEGDASVEIQRSDGVIKWNQPNPLTFTYATAATPTVTEVDPATAPSGSNATVKGSGFDCNPSPIVTIGGEANVQSCTSTEIVVTLGDQIAGDYEVKVNIPSKGNAIINDGVKFTFELAVSDVSPTAGSFGGGHELTVTGVGFDLNLAVVEICGKDAQIKQDLSSTSKLVILTPGNDGNPSQDQICDLNVKVGNANTTKASGYTYSASKTATITSVTPRRGGTGGGTKITIAGSNFGTNNGDNVVTIDGTECIVESQGASQIICETEPHSSTVKTTIHVNVKGDGNAAEATAGAGLFEYIDRWGSIWTWGGSQGNGLPREGDFVTIAKGQTILLDTDTPILAFLLINGGSLIFDRKDVILNARYILITNGGSLVVGTEDEPFEQKATIVLHGHQRQKELPIYGTKMIGVREGTLDLHGKPVAQTWTFLGETVAAGSSTIKLRDAVEWQVGDSIVVATTGFRHSQKETEKRTITQISNDKLTLTLDAALEYEHICESYTFNNKPFSMCGEVGLLSHNVKVMGSRDMQWADDIPACEDGFDTGEFSTQTCFNGRFGAETGSDQFGGQILIGPPEEDKQLAIARISYVELNYMGQAFRLGRYAIHFHMNGDMDFKSHVRGVSIWETFNRAVNIHKTHHVLVEHSVVYNIMGGAIFLEDGIEKGNVIQYNLALFVKASSSLLNDDVTPAAFWVTNPNNTIRHNHAAGGTHFGFWYRMHEKPDGPSFDASKCEKPDEDPLGEFRNNTAHSQGWFALWIFTNYFPTVGGGCEGSTDSVTAVFEGLSAWRNEKGAEWVNVGALQFKDFMMVENEKAGIELKRILRTDLFVESGPAILNSTIVGYTSNQRANECTHKGLIQPFNSGLLIKSTAFVNFDQDSCVAIGVTKIDGTCGFLCGGYEYRFSETTFVNAPNKVMWRWIHEGQYVDEDGTLTGKPAGSTATPCNDNLPPTCVEDAEFSRGAIKGCICPPGMRFHRFAFKNVKPSSLNYEDVLLTNDYGNTSNPFAEKRLTHKPGWMATLISGGTYNMYWENGVHISNFSFDGEIYGLKPTDYVIIKHKLTAQPDRFRLMGTDKLLSDSESAPLSEENVNGDFYWDPNIKEVQYMVSGKSAARRKRAAAGSTHAEAGTVDIPISPSFFTCYYANCEPPPDPNTVPPRRTRPDHAIKYSETKYWQKTDTDKYVCSRSYGAGTELPTAGSDITIATDTWLVVDVENLPEFRTVLIEGGHETALEFDYESKPDGSYYNYELTATYIIIKGRLLIGWEANPFKGQAVLNLVGDHSTEEFMFDDGTSPPIGSKAIAVFGGLDLHGIAVGVTWTSLASTASANENTLSLARAVDWGVGSEIVVAPTGYFAWETETFKITAISDDKKVLTLNDTLKYRHLAYSGSANNKPYTMAAEVGLLTRNIKIVGKHYDLMEKQSFGGRVLVSKLSQGDAIFTGFARISNTEFANTGQEGHNAAHDARFSLSFIDVVKVNQIRPSYIKSCSFHHGFSPAIGVYGTNSDDPEKDFIKIDNNVVHHTVGAGMSITGYNHSITNNLVLLMVHPGTYQDRNEQFNIDWDASIEMKATGNVLLAGNHVAGSERAGFATRGQKCTSEGQNSDRAWTGNVAHTVLIGHLLMPDSCPLAVSGYSDTRTCARMSGFTIWKAFDFGFYAQSSCSVEASDLTLVDNSIGFFSIVFAPPSLLHIADRDKHVTLQNSLVVGNSPAFDCSADVQQYQDHNVQSSGQARSLFQSESSSKKGQVGGVMWSNFNSGSNNAPEKPFKGLMSYPAIAGRMLIKDVTFADFTSGPCQGQERSYALTSNVGNEDAQHPVDIQGAAWENVDEDSKVFLFEPLTGSINPSDCVDMTCDGLKKTMATSSDGTLFGTGGMEAAIPNSAYEWDGDPRHGVGYYRAPKAMTTLPNGTRVDILSVAPEKGIIGTGTNDCTYVPSMQGYKCLTYDYKMMIIESMDSDTETRRLSPVALLGEKHLDLINGPMDHGWCAGYTCQKRISTFYTLIATGTNYEIWFTGDAPQNLRVFMLNENQDKKVCVSVWYRNVQMLVAYRTSKKHGITDERIPAANSAYDSDGKEYFKKPSSSEQWIPDCKNDPSLPIGYNYYDRATQKQYFVIGGNDVIDIKTNPLIIITFNMPPVTVDDFFGENLVNNIALFLDIPSDKIRVVDIVREGSRRKRAAEESLKVNIEIGDRPTNTSQNESDWNTLDFSQLEQAAAKIVNAIQTGNLSKTLNVTILSVVLEEPIPPADSETWKDYVELVDLAKTVEIPSDLQLITAPVADDEGNPFTIQPQLQMLSSSGSVVNQLGTMSLPWEITATVRDGSDARAKVVGTSTVKYKNGWANFTDIGISHSGSGYVIDFTVTYPADSAFKVSSSALSVKATQLSVAVITNVTNMTATFGEPVELEVEIRSNTTNKRIPDIAWKGHTWTATASIYNPSVFVGTPSGTTAQFNASAEDQTAEFTQLTLIKDPPNVPMQYFFEIQVASTPSEHTLKTMSEGILFTPDNYSYPTAEKTFSVKLTWSGLDYDTDVKADENVWAGVLFNWIMDKNTDIMVSDIAFSKGSVLSTFTLYGSAAATNTTLIGIWGKLKGGVTLSLNGKSLTSTYDMFVDGNAYYGLDSGKPPAPTEAPTGLSGSIIAVIVVVPLVFIAAVIVAYLIWRFKCQPGKESRVSPEPSNHMQSSYPPSQVTFGTEDERRSQSARNGTQIEMKQTDAK